MFFKRFYLENSVIEYDPKLYLLACVFLASKVENANIPVADFLSKIPKAPTAAALLESEFILCRGLKFEFSIQHIKWPLYGLFLDMQTYLRANIDGTSKRNATSFGNLLINLKDSYLKSVEYYKISLHTDLVFTHWPSQIAMGCFYLASKNVDFSDYFIK